MPWKEIVCNWGQGPSDHPQDPSDPPEWYKGTLKQGSLLILFWLKSDYIICIILQMNSFLFLPFRKLISPACGFSFTLSKLKFIPSNQFLKLKKSQLSIIPKSSGEEKKNNKKKNLCFKKNGWCMKLKLALQDEVMSKGEALLCLLRGAASRSVRLTLWPLEITNKNALLIIVFFCMEVVFFVACLFFVLFCVGLRMDSQSSPSHWEAAKAYLIDCTLA